MGGRSAAGVTPHRAANGRDIARSGDGLGVVWGWYWRGDGMELERTGDGIGEVTVIYGELQKNAKKMQKNAKIFAYIKKK